MVLFLSKSVYVVDIFLETHLHPTMNVSLILLQSLDGFIAHDLTDNLSWGTKEDKQFFRTKTKEAGCMIMGSSTFENMPFPLAFQNRFSYVLTSNPQKYSELNQSPLVRFLSATPTEILQQAKQDGYENVVVIGGGKINSAFLQNNLIDEIYVTIAPHIFGDGIAGFGRLNLNTQLHLESVKTITEHEILCHYKVVK